MGSNWKEHKHWKNRKQESQAPECAKWGPIVRRTHAHELSAFCNWFCDWTDDSTAVFRKVAVLSETRGPVLSLSQALVFVPNRKDASECRLGLEELVYSCRRHQPWTDFRSSVYLHYFLQLKAPYPFLPKFINITSL